LKKAILFLFFQTLFICYAGPELKVHIGNATYYAGRFEHRRTSNGERYCKDSLTCATRLYPFGTMLLVTNLSNNKSVIVRVNDRCPYRRNRIIDLSKAAATEIGMLRAGRAKVRLEPLTGQELMAVKLTQVIKDTVKSVSKIEPEKKTDEVIVNGEYGIQVNSFKDKKNVKHELVMLHRKGYSNILTIPGIYKKQKVTKVIVGPYETKKKARQELEKVVSSGFKTAVLVKL